MEHENVDGEVLNTHVVLSSDVYCAPGHPVLAVSVGLKAPSIKRSVCFPTPSAQAT